MALVTQGVLNKVKVVLLYDDIIHMINHFQVMVYRNRPNNELLLNSVFRLTISLSHYHLFQEGQVALHSYNVFHFGWVQPAPESRDYQAGHGENTLTFAARSWDSKHHSD